MLRRVIAVLVIAVVAVPLIVAGVIWATLDSGAARSWAEIAVEHATGHVLRIAGPVRIAPSFVPTLTAVDVALINPPGFSRPDLAHASRVEAQVALLPLLRGKIEVQRLRVVGLDAKLEVNAAGQGNWQRSPGPPPASPSALSQHRRFALVLRRVEMDGSVLAWSGPGGPLRLAVLQLSAKGKGKGTLKLAGTVQANGVPLQVHGTAASGAPWSIHVALAGQGTNVVINFQGGTAPQVGVIGEVNAAALDPRLNGLGEVELNGTWSSEAAHLHAEAGPFTLGSGLHVEHLAVDAPALDQPIRASAVLTGAARLSLSAQAGPPAAMLAGTPLPLALAASGQGGTARLQGTLSDPKRLRGLDATLSVAVADLAALVPGAPPLHDATLTARLTNPASLSQGLAIQDLAVSTPSSDLAGNLAVAWQSRPALRGGLLSKRLDADGLLALSHEQPAPAPATPAPKPVPTRPRTRLIPDTPVPVGGLRAADIDLSYAAGALLLGGTEFHAVQAHIGLKDGTLHLDPLSATSPGGSVQASAVLDAAALPPRVSLALKAPSLALAGFQPGAAGTVAVNADIAGQGATWRQVAASLGGEADLTGVDDQLDLDALATLRDALHRAGVPAELSGQAHVRCVAVRAVANDGIATVNPILLDAGRIGLRGDGRVDLRDEVPDLHLRALVRFGPADAEVPLRVTGTLAAPKVAAEAVGGRFGLMPAGKARDYCGPALADARSGRLGPEPAPLQAPAGRAGHPADLLRSLLR